MRIDIDTFGVLSRFVRDFPPESVIFRQGQPGEDLYVILRGEVSITRSLTGEESSEDSDRTVALATLRSGDFFGEMSLFTREPRSATARTVTHCRIVVLNRQQMLYVIRNKPEFAMKLLEGLCRRLNQTNERLVKESLEVRKEGSDGVAVELKKNSEPYSGEASGGNVGAPAPEQPVVDPDESVKVTPGHGGQQDGGAGAVTCLVCAGKFIPYRLPARSAQLLSRDSDLYPRYGGENPLYYAIRVCPHCGFAAYSSSFSDLDPEGARRFRGLPAPPSSGLELLARLCQKRDLELAIHSYLLAISCYQRLEAPANTMAGLHHRLAWLYREAGNEDEERKNLTLTLKLYRSIYDEGDIKPESPLGEAGLIYLIGELYRRLGNSREAAIWLSRAVCHRDIKKKPLVAEMAHEQWLLLREQLSAKGQD